MSNITININEISSILAHNGMYDEVTNPLYNGSEVNEEDDLYNVDNEGNTSYKEEFQLVFDRHYDYFYDMLINNKIND